MTNHGSFKGDYSYAYFGAENFLFPGARAGVKAPAFNTINGRKASNDLDMHAVKLGLNYRL